MSKSKGRLATYKAFHKAVRAAVMAEWDPIGVKEIAEAKGEYDAYVPAMVGLLMKRKSADEIFDYLWWLETEQMGLSGDPRVTERFAARLLTIAGELQGSQR